MANDLPPGDMRNVWQSQPREFQKMSSQEIRTAAEHYQRKIARRNLREYLGCLVIVASFGWFAWQAPSFLARAGHLLVMAGTLYVAVQLHRAGSARAVPAEMGRLDGIAFHRAELGRQLHVYQSAWRWVLAVVPGLTLLMAGAARVKPRVDMPGGPLTPLLIGLGGWVILLIWLRKRNQAKARAIQREIESLDTEAQPS